MATPRISISIDPADLEFADGSRLDSDKLLAAVREFAEAAHPDATFVTLQIGHRQGECWAWVDADTNAGDELMDAFWAARGSDETLFEEAT